MIKFLPSPRNLYHPRHTSSVSWKRKGFGENGSPAVWIIFIIRIPLRTCRDRVGKSIAELGICLCKSTPCTSSPFSFPDGHLEMPMDYNRPKQVSSFLVALQGRHKTVSEPDEWMTIPCTSLRTLLYYLLPSWDTFPEEQVPRRLFEFRNFLFSLFKKPSRQIGMNSIPIRIITGRSSWEHPRR